MESSSHSDGEDQYEDEEADGVFDPRLEQKIQLIKNNLNSRSELTAPTED
jgi:hypothetical protein